MIFKKKKHIKMLPDGTYVYCVDEDKMHKLPIQKILNIQEALNYISLIGVDKHTHSEAIKRIKDNIVKYMDSKEINLLLDAMTYIDYIDGNMDKHNNTIATVNAMVFDLFYYLDGEDPFVYSEDTLNRKKELLKKYPLEMSFFFRKTEVTTFMRNYGLTLNGGIQIAALQSVMLRELRESHSSQISTAKE